MRQLGGICLWLHQQDSKWCGTSQGWALISPEFGIINVFCGSHLPSSAGCWDEQCPT